MISFRKTLFIHTKFPKYISSFQTISFHNIPMQLTEKEKELIEVIRNYKKSRIFFHWTYEFYIRELFEKLLNGEEDNENEEN